MAEIEITGGLGSALMRILEAEDWRKRLASVTHTENLQRHTDLSGVSEFIVRIHRTKCVSARSLFPEILYQHDGGE